LAGARQNERAKERLDVSLNYDFMVRLAAKHAPPPHT
jgi:hypothetical protein